jgi:dipeptidyl aminopeptidase/acylaminoacyl peptidase
MLPKLPVCLLLTALALPVGAQMPPLVDRDLFFGEIEIGGAQISPDGKFISFLKPYKGARNIWVKKADEPFSAAKPMTAETKRPIPGYIWSRDARYLLYVQDNAGDENYNVYAVNPADAPDAATGVPKARDLTNLKGVRVFIYAVPRSDPDTIYIGLNDRDKAWHDLYKLKLSTGERTLVSRNTGRITGWIFDNKDQLRLAARSAANGDTEILRVDAGKFTQIYSCDVLESCGPVHFDKDNKMVYFETNKGPDVDLNELVLMDPASGRTRLVEVDPLQRVDFGSAIFSEVTDELIATTYVDDRLRIYWKNKAFENDYKWLQSKLPNKEIGFGSHTKDENTWIISAFSDVEPGETYLFDRKAKKLQLQYKVREKLPREALSPMKAVKYPSSDGLEIPAYLTLPKGLPGKNLPVVVFPHGGPWARDTWGYNTFAQFLANRGYAVLNPNFRGSTGYGKKFLNAGNRQWGEKMQDDVTWGVKYLIAQGIADPKRVGIAGGSYGGYTTLAGVAFTPGVYAAAVDIVGPSNLITLLESIPPYWEPIRKMFYVRMGDPNTPEGKKQLEAQSPLNSASKIRTPLLVVQGANDPRVNKREADQIVIALRDRGFPVEYLVAPDEGHGFARPINNLAMIAAMEKFFSKYLDGRYQAAMNDETATRLKEITVDPKTVVLAKVVEASSVGAPKPASAPMMGPLNYKAKIEAGGQTINLDISSEIKEENGQYRAVDTMKSAMMGEAVDTAILDKDTLTVLKRSVKQGPVSVEVEFKDGKATGKMSMAGNERPINADVGGPVFADAAGSNQVIAALPLAGGYTTMFRNFDFQSGKVKLLQLKVAGSEQVTVPAGTFEAFRLEIASADGGSEKQTLWVAKSPRKVVKVEATMPQMAGAKMTLELAQ